jgi:hypothetical protein
MGATLPLSLSARALERNALLTERIGNFRYTFGPRPRRAPQIECNMMTCVFRLTEKYTWYAVFSRSQRRMSLFFR